MEYPEYEEIAKALLAFIHANGGSVNPKECYESLADHFKLSLTDRNMARKDGRAGRQWDNRVQWTRQRLVNRGSVDERQRGLWKIKI